MERTADLSKEPEPTNEVRLRKGDCVVTFWLPASAGVAAEGMSALAKLGFEFDRGEEPAHPARAE